MEILTRRLLAGSLTLLLCACGGSSSSGSTGSGNANSTSSPEGIALFEASGSATPDDIFGIWGMPSITSGNIRLNPRTRFEPESIAAAVQCVDDVTQTDVIAYVSSSARISNTKIDVLEANADVRTMPSSNGGTLRCNANTSVASTAKCEPGAVVPRDCFELKGTTLTIYDKIGSPDKLTKISD